MTLQCLHTAAGVVTNCGYNTTQTKWLPLPDARETQKATQLVSKVTKELAPKLNWNYSARLKRTSLHQYLAQMQQEIVSSGDNNYVLVNLNIIINIYAQIHWIDIFNNLYNRGALYVLVRSN